MEVIDCGTLPNGQIKSAEEDVLEEIKIAPNPTKSSIWIQIPDSMNWEKVALINSQEIILNE